MVTRGQNEPLSLYRSHTWLFVRWEHTRRNLPPTNACITSCSKVLCSQLIHYFIYEVSNQSHQKNTHPLAPAKSLYMSCIPNWNLIAWTVVEAPETKKLLITCFWPKFPQKVWDRGIFTSKRHILTLMSTRFEASSLNSYEMMKSSQTDGRTGDPLAICPQITSWGRISWFKTNAH